jgi:undecaprenyl-diphosphatase
MDLYAWDLGMMFSIGGRQQPWLSPFMLTVTHLGDMKFLLGAVLLVVGLFALQRRFVTAAALLGGLLLGLAISETTKPLVDRPRPDVTWRLIPLPEGGSFPSGHALCSMAFYGGLGLLLARQLPPRSLWILFPITGIGLSLLIGYSRCYLGVHHPLDVFGGWMAGLACALLAYWVDEKWGRPRVALPALPERPRTAPSSEGTIGGQADLSGCR